MNVYEFVSLGRCLGERDISPLGVIKVEFCKAVAIWRMEADGGVKDKRIGGGALIGLLKEIEG